MSTSDEQRRLREVSRLVNWPHATPQSFSEWFGASLIVMFGFMIAVALIVIVIALVAS